MLTKKYILKEHIKYIVKIFNYKIIFSKGKKFYLVDFLFSSTLAIILALTL